MEKKSSSSTVICALCSDGFDLVNTQTNIVRVLVHPSLKTKISTCQEDYVFLIIPVNDLKKRKFFHCFSKVFELTIFNRWLK
ncbi:unnamed protein product [Adineta ricciae]|uniref:Uncharacterized protein n=1 Tax=Adineta ricciae TaxID=249248 RepID=A0A815D3P5_ADIRI|nr:unnamed protein product [Adineta ricciae]